MIVVTGGAGFIGSNIVTALAGSGARVAVCDRLRQGDKWRNLTREPLAEIIPPQALAEWLPAHTAQIEAIVHMGAISSTTERDADLIVAAHSHSYVGRKSRAATPAARPPSMPCRT